MATTASTKEPPTIPPTQRSVVSSFLCTGIPHTPSFRVSIFKRSSRVRVYQNLWAACSGSIDPADRTPFAAALREIAEETSLPAAALTLLGAGEAYEIFDAALRTNWTIHPFLFRLNVSERASEERTEGEETGADVEAQKRVVLDWEHTEVRFVRVEEVEGFETVAHLGRSLRTALEGVARGHAREE
ncbi:MAG: hypothetical protein LQ347_005382 [Umbilicaria vellea]|nr:MAG: hypothetical protein LQ347_005382 [Umbilicaria vellea]